MGSWHSEREWRFNSPQSLVILMLLVLAGMIGHAGSKLGSIEGRIPPANVTVRPAMQTKIDTWEWEAPNGGCVTKRIETMRNLGEDDDAFCNRHDEIVAKAMKKFPPK